MLEGILNVFRALLAPVIAGVVAYIAYQQHKVNRDRLRLGLYDKRFKVFRGLIDLLGYIVTRGDVTNEELSHFYTATNEKEFLFNDDILGYLEEFQDKAKKLQWLQEKIKNPLLAPPGEAREKVFEERKEVFNWLTAQFEVSRNKFGKDLSFRQLANLSERRTMNWKRGFKRITLVLSLLAFTFWVALGIIVGYIIEGVVDALWQGPLIGLAFFAGIWVIYYGIYYIGGYIVEGFRDDEPKDEQKQQVNQDGDI